VVRSAVLAEIGNVAFNQFATVRSRSAQSLGMDRDQKASRQETGLVKDYFLRWRILARMRRFLRPSFRRPFPDFLVPKAISEFEFDGSKRYA